MSNITKDEVRRVSSVITDNKSTARRCTLDMFGLKAEDMYRTFWKYTYSSVTGEFDITEDERSLFCYLVSKARGNRAEMLY